MKKNNVVLIDRDWWKSEEHPVVGNAAIKVKRKISEKYYSVAEVAKILNVGIWSIYDYINEGEIDSITVGRGKRIPQEALQDYISKNGSTKTR